MTHSERLFQLLLNKDQCDPKWSSSIEAILGIIETLNKRYRQVSAYNVINNSLSYEYS